MLVCSGVATLQKGDQRMSTSLLYHAWGIRGYHHVRYEFVEGRIVEVIEQPSWTLRCPACGSSRVIRSGQFERTFKVPPIGRKTMLIRLPIQRVECRDCGAVRQ